MKTKMLIFALLLISFSNPGFSGVPNDVGEKVIASFQKDFSNAREISWTNNNIYEKATFILDGQALSAFYDHNGELIALARKIESSQLPVSLLLNLNKIYKGYLIKELNEIDHDNNALYYAVVINSDQQLILESSGYTWTVYKKDSKKGGRFRYMAGKD